MVKILDINIPLIVGDDDYLIEDGENNSKIVIYEDESKDIWFKVSHPDGVARFYITRKMAREICATLLEITK